MIRRIGFLAIVSIHRIGWYIDPRFPDADDRTCSIPSSPDIEAEVNRDKIILDNGRPRLLSLKECVKYFVDHRHDVTIRRTQ